MIKFGDTVNFFNLVSISVHLGTLANAISILWLQETLVSIEYGLQQLAVQLCLGGVDRELQGVETGRGRRQLRCIYLEKVV